MVLLLFSIVIVVLGILAFIAVKKAKRNSFTDPQTWKGIGLGLLTGVPFALGGFFLLHDHVNMGVVLFILLPFATGFAMGMVTRPPELVAGTVLLSLFLV